MADTLNLFRQKAVGFIVWLDLSAEKLPECQTSNDAQSDSTGRPLEVRKSDACRSSKMRRVKNEREAECAPNKKVDGEREICSANPKWRTSEFSLESKGEQQDDR